MTIHILEGVNEWDETDTWIDANGDMHPTSYRISVDVAYCGYSDYSSGLDESQFVFSDQYATCEECLERYALAVLGDLDSQD